MYSLNFDEPVVGFLQKFQDNSLLTNVNIECVPDALMAFMTKVMPLITSFNMCILRYPIGAKQEWIEEMSKYDDCKYRNITISVLPEIDERWFPDHLFDAIRGLEILMCYKIL
jgi:hypothetical protein